MFNGRTASCRFPRRVSLELKFMTAFGFGLPGTLWLALRGSFVASAN
jgi:hypothetical protein